MNDIAWNEIDILAEREETDNIVRQCTTERKINVYVIVEWETNVTNPIATQLIQFAFVAPLQTLAKKITLRREIYVVNSPVMQVVRRDRFSVFRPLFRNLRHENTRHLSPYD